MSKARSRRVEFPNPCAVDTDYVYTPYGLVRTAGAITQPIQWFNEFADLETTLIYYNYRYYNPLDGRWTRRDPLGENVRGNTYCFIANYITYGVDYLGLFIDTIWDVGNMVWDVGVIIAGVVTGDDDMISDGSTDFALDTLAAITPGIPAGASKGVRASQKASRQAAKSAEKKDLKKRLKRIAECEAIYSQYKVYHCKKCKKCSTCAEIGEQIACWTAFSAGRKLYLDKKCDYYLEGSNREGSRAKEENHKLEYAKAAKCLTDCTIAFKNCR